MKKDSLWYNSLDLPITNLSHIRVPHLVGAHIFGSNGSPLLSIPQAFLAFLNMGYSVTVGDVVADASVI